jgi:hypothetical protein
MSAEPIEPEGTGAKRRRSKKRANGQGSIYQRKDGRWAGAAFVLSSDGTFKRVPVYGRTAEEVDAKLTELKARSNRGLPADATGWTVKAYAAYWLDHVAANKIRPSTLARYRSMMERYVLPPLGRKRLTALSPADVRVMLARTAASRSTGRKDQPEAERPVISSRSVQQVHAVLRSMLAQAVREELLGRNWPDSCNHPPPIGRRSGRGRRRKLGCSWRLPGLIGCMRCSWWHLG